MPQTKPKKERLPVDELDDELAADKAGDIKLVAGPDRAWSLWKKIHWIQGNLDAIPKDAELQVGQGRAVPVLSHNAMVAAVRPMLDLAGLVLLSTVTDYEVDIQLVQKANGDTYSAYFHKLRKHYTLVNVDGPEEKFEFDGYGTAVTPTDKGYGAAESYSKKYALRSLFLIETDDDPDAGGENVNIATPQARASTGAPARVPRPAAAAEQPAIQTTAHPAAVEIPDEAWREVANLWHDRGTISDKQLGRLFAIARSEGGWQSGDLVEEVVKHHLGIESMHAIPWGKPYDALVEIFRGFPPAQDPDTSAAEALEPPPDFDDGDGYA